VIALDPRTRPAVPPSEVEWEDLLLRIEITPRALRVAVEDAAGAAAALAPLRAAVLEEALLQALLESMADGREAPCEAGVAGVEGDPEAIARQFASLRARTFAIVQRRGLGVWEWRLRGGPWEGATAYQLLQGAAARDGRTLAAVRGAR
jgi:hypothetical protein